MFRQHDEHVKCAGHIAQRFLARHHTVLQIGSTVFVHGGILPSHADYGLERINRCAATTEAQRQVAIHRC